MTRLVRVGDLAQQIRGVTFSQSDASAEPKAGFVPVLRAGNIQEAGLTFDDLVYVPAERLSDRQFVRKNDVVIAASSGSLEVVGKAARSEADFSGGFGAFLKVLRPGSEVDPRYFAHFFKTRQYRRTVSALAAGANINNLKNEHLDELLMPVPPLDDQRRIAAILDQADEIRSRAQSQRDVLVALKVPIFSQMFGECEPTAMLGDFADIQGGLQVSGKRASLPVELPYLRVANVYRDRLDLLEIKTIRATQAEADRTRLAVGDLLFVEGHGNPDEVGRAAIWDGSIPNCVHQNHLIRVRLNPATLLPEFAVGWFNSPSGASYFKRAGKTTSGLNTISASQVRSAPIPAPSLNEQREYARRCQQVSQVSALCDRSLSLADELFQATQSRAFAGQL